MNDIVIKDTGAVEYNCELGSSLCNELEDYIEELERSLKALDACWESSGSDKESYVVELERQLVNFRALHQAFTKIFTTMHLYAKSVVETSLKQVN